MASPDHQLRRLDGVEQGPGVISNQFDVLEPFGVTIPFSVTCVPVIGPGGCVEAKGAADPTLTERNSDSPTKASHLDNGFGNDRKKAATSLML